MSLNQEVSEGKTVKSRLFPEVEKRKKACSLRLAGVKYVKTSNNEAMLSENHGVTLNLILYSSEIKWRKAHSLRLEEEKQ